MLDMELSSSITARFSTRLCDFCRTNLDAALSVHRQTSTDHQIATRGHDLEYRGTEECIPSSIALVNSAGSQPSKQASTKQLLAKLEAELHALPHGQKS